MPHLFVAARRLALAAALLSLGAAQPVFAQSDIDPELRVQQLENQLRRLTGQNEELQYRNRQLEDQLRALQGTSPSAPPPRAAIAPPDAPAPRPVAPPVAVPYETAAPAPIIQDAPPPVGTRRRGDAFDPSQNPNAPGAPRALGGGGQLPAPAALPPPPSQTPKDDYDLGIGYIQRRDYTLAEETMRGFVQRYPDNALVPDSQYWIGESLYQRQRYRDAAEAFLTVTTKHETSAKAPDSLLRLGQSLAALKEKEAACAALGEVVRKYPRASAGVKQAVDREQKRVKC